MSVFNKSLVLKYLGLPDDYEPCPQEATIPFLVKYVSQLPPHLLEHFGYITSPRDRTVVTTIRNRRLKYASSNPPELRFASASRKWPHLWQGRERPGVEEASEERAWAKNDFLQGSTKHVGKLGSLLGEYEEEREAERVRVLRREGAAVNDFVPEEDDSSDEDSNDIAMEEPLEEARTSFERQMRERFVYGLLEPFEYEKVDWDESLDSENDREVEERWFEAEESE